MFAVNVLDGRSTNRGAQGQRKNSCFIHTNTRRKVEIQGLHHTLLFSLSFLLLLPHPSVPLWDALEEKGFLLLLSTLDWLPITSFPAPKLSIRVANSQKGTYSPEDLFGSCQECHVLFGPTPVVGMNVLLDALPCATPCPATVEPLLWAAPGWSRAG